MRAETVKGSANGEGICFSVKKPRLGKTGMSFPDAAGASGWPSLANLTQGWMGANMERIFGDLSF